MHALKYALLATLVFSAPAFAADLAPQSIEPAAPIAVAPTFSWTGFYAGVHAGAAFADTKLDSYKVNATGFIGGAHAGYNLQLNSNVVIGLEGDIDYTSLSKKKLVESESEGDLFRNGYVKAESQWQGSVRARLGYAIDRFLPYVTGGVAFGDEKFSVSEVSNVDTNYTASSSKTAVGWTAGGGAEYAVTDNWLVRGEVRYTDLGNRNFSFDTIDSGAIKSRFDQVSTTLGASYKF